MHELWAPPGIPQSHQKAPGRALRSYKSRAPFKLLLGSSHPSPTRSNQRRRRPRNPSALPRRRHRAPSTLPSPAGSGPSRTHPEPSTAGMGSRCLVPLARDTKPCMWLVFTCLLITPILQVGKPRLFVIAFGSPKCRVFCVIHPFPLVTPKAW